MAQLILVFEEPLERYCICCVVEPVPEDGPNHCLECLHMRGRCCRLHGRRKADYIRQLLSLDANETWPR